MADLNDPAIQQAFRDFARQLDRFGASIGGASSAASTTLTNFGANLRTVGQGMARLRNDMDSGRRTFAESVQVYRQLKEDFEALDDATRATAAGQRIREAQNVMANQLVRQNLGELAGEIAKIGLVGALTFYKNQMITAVQSLQENVGGMQMAFNLQQQAVTDLYRSFGQVGDAVTAAGVGLALFNPAAGAFVAGLGMLGKTAAEIMGGIETESLQMLQREFKKTNDSFRLITNSGALFGLGMTEMRMEARRVQLDLGDYSKVIAANSVDLAKLGGTVTSGARRFADVNYELLRYRKELLDLGIAEADQAQATIDYMSLLQDVGKLENKSAQQLAAETNDYLKNLRAITAITGEDAKKAQQRARDASMQAAVNNKLSMAGEGAATKFRALISQFPGLEKSIQQLYTLGSVVDPVQAAFLASVPGLDRVLKYNVAQLEKPGESLDQFNINLQESLYQQSLSIRDQARAVQGTFGMINVANNNLGELSTLTTQYSVFGEKLLRKGDEFGESRVMGLAGTVDELTSSVSRSQVLFGQFNSVVSQIIDGPLRDFATKGPEIIKEGVKKVLDGLGPYLKAHEIILRFDKNLDKAITDAVGAALRSQGVRFEEQRYAQGGIVNGPTRILAGEAGPEAIVPLSRGRSIPVDIKINENLAAKEFNSAFAQAMAQIKESDRVKQNNLFQAVQTRNEADYSGSSVVQETLTNNFTKAVLDLKTQMASDNDKQIGIMQQQIDKLDSLITHMRESVQASENIAHVLS